MIVQIGSELEAGYCPKQYILPQLVLIYRKLDLGRLRKSYL